MEQGAWSRKQGAGSMEQGAGSIGQRAKGIENRVIAELLRPAGVHLLFSIQQSVIGIQ